MKKFEIGKEYTTRMIGDSESTITFKVIARTAKTITLEGIGVSSALIAKGKKCRIIDQVSSWRNAETIFPLGQYSMAPTLSADM